VWNCEYKKPCMYRGANNQKKDYTKMISSDYHPDTRTRTRTTHHIDIHTWLLYSIPNTVQHSKAQ